jgi:hypothetical protein
MPAAATGISPTARQTFTRCSHAYASSGGYFRDPALEQLRMRPRLVNFRLVTRAVRESRLTAQLHACVPTRFPESTMQNTVQWCWQSRQQNRK